MSSFTNVVVALGTCLVLSGIIIYDVVMAIVAQALIIYSISIVQIFQKTKNYLKNYQYQKIYYIHNVFVYYRENR